MQQHDKTCTVELNFLPLGKFLMVCLKLSRLVAAWPLVCTALVALPAVAGDETNNEETTIEEEPAEGQVRLYRTRSERREAGLHRQLTPWLRFSGLAELEAIGEDYTVEDMVERFKESETVANIQLGFVAEPLDWLQGELIVEYDSQTNEVFLEEATISVDVGDWELSYGKQYLPFGQYFSNFITGPILELGETQETAATLTWDYEDRIEFSTSVYEGVARRIDKSDNGLDWAFALNGVVHERLAVGISYLSDLGDAGGRLLEDAGNRFVKKVPGLSAYAIWIGESMETTFEVVGAERSFEELEGDRNQPLAWNVELALFIHPKAELDFRLEGSRQIEGFPHIQWGVATTIVLHPRATMTLELLQGEFKRGLATDDDDNPFRNVTTIGAQFAIAF